MRLFQTAAGAIFVPVLLLLSSASAQTATYHLLHNASTINTTFDQLQPTAGSTATTLTATLTNKNAGDYLIKEFETQTGVPNSPGVIPSGSTLNFSIYMRKTADPSGVIVKPEAKVRLNNATGTSLCSVIGATALTTTVTQMNLSCSTAANVTMSTSDRFYLWVGVNISAKSSTAYSGELDIESAFDSQITVPLATGVPAIATLTPTAGPVNSSIVIAGTNFRSSQGGSTVKFGTVTATPTAWSSTSITAPVPTSVPIGTASVTVTVGGQTSAGAPFTVNPPPTISSLSPPSGSVGSSVTITGNNFGSLQGTVTFNGTQATINSWSAGSIVAVVPSGATTGAVVVTLPGGVSATGPSFTVAPVISNLNPSSGRPGASVTINGSNFAGTTGTVTFNGQSAAISTWSNTSIVAVVPNGASSGNVVVTAGTLQSNPVSFTVLAPTISTLTPSSGEPRASITITGSNFGTSGGSVTFNGQTASTTSWSDSSIVAVVPDGASSGNVVVSNGGLQSNGVNFTVLVPTISSLNPGSGVAGTSVTITGSNFGASAGTVTFNGVSASISSWSETSIVAVVPNGASTGNVVVSHAGLQSNGVIFTLTPNITSVSPASGWPGASITVSGINFGASQGSSTITFNGTAATPTNWSDTQIVVPVPSGATSGNIVVTVNGVPSAGASFTLLSYGFVRPIAIDHRQVVRSDQTDFPVLISGTFPYLATVGNGGKVQNANGYDIIFTSDAAGQMKLDHEIDSYDPVTGNASFWVRIPALSHTTDTAIYMWYGSSSVSASQENKAGVWSNGYGAVWHFGDGNTLSAADSTGINNGIVSNVSATHTAKIGGAAAFPGASNSYLRIPSNAQIKPTSALTLEAWVNPTQLGNWHEIFIVDYRADGTWNPPYVPYVLSAYSNTSQIQFGITGSNGTNVVVNSTRSMPLSQWTHVVGTYDGTTLRLYANGVAEPAINTTSAPISYGSSRDLTLGNDTAYQSLTINPWNGSMDEMRISSVARSADWIATEYNNQNSPATFVFVCAEVSGGTQPSPCSLSLPASSFSYSRPIVIDHTKVTNTDQTDFPVLISGTFSYLATIPNSGQLQNANGYDIVFTSDAAGQTKLDYEIDAYDQVTGNASFWVRIPTLLHLTDTTIYMWYGSSAVQASQENKSGVWSNGFAGVWHFGGNTLSTNDSTANQNNGANHGVTSIAGKIGGAGSFDGTGNTYLDIPSSNSYKPATALTMEAWVKMAGPTSWPDIFSLDYRADGSWSGPFQAYALDFYSNTLLPRIDVATGGAQHATNGGQNVATGQWAHMVGTYDGANMIVYINGASVVTTPQTGAISYGTSKDLDIGTRSPYTSAEAVNGVIDEARISTVARSANWIATEYNNQSSPSSFASIQGSAYFSITTSSLPTAAQYIDYGVTLMTSGGAAPYSWSITSGALPSGMSLDPSTGLISGRTSTQGTSNFTVQVVDGSSKTAIRNLSLVVTAPPPVVIGNTSLPASATNTSYNATLSATGGVSPYTWSITAGALPSGLTLTSSTGVISGTTPATGGLSSFTVQALDSVGATATKNLSILIFHADSLAPSTAPIGGLVTINGTGFGASQGTVAFNGVAASVSSWSDTSITVTVPAGIATGAVSVVVNAYGIPGNTLPITIISAPALTSVSPSSGTVGTTVTISGSSFGATQGTSRVTFNNLDVTVTSWSDTQIVAIVSRYVGTGPVKVIVDGSQSNGLTFTMPTLPAGWSDLDIGSVGAPGSASFSNGTFTVTANGNIGGTSDSFHFVYQPLFGDGSIVARVASLQGAQYPQAGLMIRETLAANAKDAFLYFIPNQPRWSYRSTTGGNTTQDLGSFVNPSAPYWVKLVRSGDTFTGYMSYDGIYWTQTGGTTTIPMGQSVYIGMAFSLGTATFDHVSLDSAAAPAPVITSLVPTTGDIGTQLTISGSHFGTTATGSLVTLNGTPLPVSDWSDTSIVTTIPAGAISGFVVVAVGPSMNESNFLYFQVTSQPLPVSWLDRDIGTVSQPGTVSYSANTFTIGMSATTGGGIAGTWDVFHFIYQSLSGDGSIVARVASLQGAQYPQAGVMIRETLNPNAKDVFLYFQPNQPRWFYRSTTGGNTTQELGSFVNPSAPYWVKLIRTGDVFTGYISNDGLNWVQTGTATVTMAQNVYIGLASSLGTATFDYVSVDSAAAPAPAIAGLSASTGSIGSQVTITGSHFGAVQNGSAVMMNGIAAPINSWSDTSIVFTIPTGALSGLMFVRLTPTMNNSNPVYFSVTTQPLPSGWFDVNINPGYILGSATYSAGTFTVNGTGGIGGASDSFNFAYQSLSGDGSISARVATVGTAQYPQAGVMIRESLAGNASNAFLFFQPNQPHFYWRAGASTGSNLPVIVNPPAPYWVKLVRDGSSFFSFFSTDGVSWSDTGSASIPMAQNVYLGLASSGSGSSLNTATFDNVIVTAGTTPYILGVSPTTGVVGTSVTITGSSFGATQGTTAVKFNGASATSITSWSDTQIVAIVPDAATSGPLTVVRNNIESTRTTNFTVPPPNVTGVSPTGGPVGTQFTVTGSGFQNNQRDSTIRINGTAGTVVSWSDTQIVAQVVSGSTTGSVTVVVNSISSNTNQVFTVVSPIISSLAPPAGAVGGTITINGSGFGGTQGSSSVKFNGVAASISSWSDTIVKAVVPATASSGPLTVTNFGATSNGVQFDLQGAPSVASISPSVGYVGNEVTITGSGFGASQSNSTVTFGNEAVGTPSSWSDTRIVVPIPSGAIYGPVEVKIAGLSALSGQIDVASVAQVTDSLGHVTNYLASVRGGQTRIYSSDGPGCSTCTLRGASFSTYDDAGHLLSFHDALDHVTNYTYDGQGNVASETRHIDANTIAQSIYTYNGFGEVVTAKDPLNHTTTNAYNPNNGNLLTVTTPAPDGSTPASVTTFTYDPNNGELLTIEDPLHHVTTLTYTTPAGLVHTVKDANQKVTRYEYDSRGNRTDVYDALNHHTHFDYDPLSNYLTKITYDDGTYVQFGYDNRGRRTSVTDQNLYTTTYDYDDADRLRSVTDAATNLTQYGYNTESNLTSITDAMNRITSFDYDQKGRVKKTIFPSTLFEAYVYDDNDNLSSKTDRKNQTVTYFYDWLNRLTQKLYPDSTQVNYIYDLAGKITQVSDPTGTYGFGYDNMDRLTSTTTQYSFIPGQIFTNGYSYDAASNRSSFQAPDSSTTTYGYDVLNRLTDQTNSWAGHFVFGYDDLSRRTSLARPNGVNTSYSYDNLSRLLSVLHQQGANTVDGAVYTYDNAGNRNSEQNLLNGVTENYVYDAIYQLKQVTQGSTTTESYTYDAVGNRLSSLSVSQYNYDSSNHLNSSSDGVTYTYDNNGNMLTKTDANGTAQYAWDFENRLTSVTLPGSGGVVTFKYDPFGKRIQKSEPLGPTNYLYDVMNVTEEVDNSGNALADYTHGAVIDETLSMLRGTTSYDLADGLGSITSLRNMTGELVNSYRYDSFGKLTASTGTVTNPFQYTGREFDKETGLYFNRARYYDPNGGRFISEDPIAFQGGINFYSYSFNSPTNLRDPSGRSAAAATWPILEGFGGVICFGSGVCETVVIVGGAVVSVAATGYLVYNWYESRSRGRSDPIPYPGTKNPGQCDKEPGKCKPCPPSSPYWDQPGNAHGGTTGVHYHWYVWNQKPYPDCTCYPARMSGGSPPTGGTPWSPGGAPWP
jgi:RHS repeat-associated protein